MDRESVLSQRGKNSDPSLIRSFLGGNPRAFDSLVKKYQNRIFNICYRLLGNYDEADDSAQEVFIKVFRSLKGFQFRSSFSTWLYRIAVNTCKNKLSSMKYRFNRMAIRLDKNGLSTVELHNSASSPVSALERREREAVIQRALDSLPKDQKMVVVLRDVEGLSYEEVVKITGFNQGTVKSKLARARSKLRESLRGRV